jgi:predicted GNAT family acetyltransferase
MRGCGEEVVSVTDGVEVTRNDDEDRWEARIDGELAGVAEFQLRDGLIIFTHTQVYPAYEGRGVGGALARQALDEVAAEGTRKVRPRCPFFKSWIRRHPEYGSMVEGAA